MLIAKFLLVILFGYLLGSIPFGVLVGRKVARVDVRNYGSGKTGATNVLRVAGKKAAAAVVGLDMLKGAVAVVVAGLMFGGEHVVVAGSTDWWMTKTAIIAAALAAVVGHIWPVFLKFHGGRGVSTFFGGLVALSPVVALFGGEVFVLSAGLTRFASVGSIVGAVGTSAILVPLTIVHGFPVEYLIYAALGTVVIIVMHRDNIVRLIRGKERKIGEKTESAVPPGSNPE